MIATCPVCDRLRQEDTPEGDTGPWCECTPDDVDAMYGCGFAGRAEVWDPAEWEALL